MSKMPKGVTIIFRVTLVVYIYTLKNVLQIEIFILQFFCNACVINWNFTFQIHIVKFGSMSIGDYIRKLNCRSPVLDGLILRPFTADDIPQVNKLWNFGGTPSTEVYLSYLQSHGFPNMAAFTAMTGEMVGFLLCNADMNLAAANVTPAYRGRQLFQAMAAEWCKAMAVVGHGETFAFVDEWNEASKRSLMRLGGKRVENWNVAYLLFTPKNCDPNDPLLLWYNVINGKIKSLPKTG